MDSEFLERLGGASVFPLCASDHFGQSFRHFDLCDWNWSLFSNAIFCIVWLFDLVTLMSVHYVVDAKVARPTQTFGVVGCLASMFALGGLLETRAHVVAVVASAPRVNCFSFLASQTHFHDINIVQRFVTVQRIDFCLVYLFTVKLLLFRNQRVDLVS